MSTRYFTQGLLGLTFLLLAGTATAAIFRCPDESGRMVFTDTPCPETGTRVMGTVTSLSDTASSVSPTVGSVAEVRKASDGLSLVRRDGFGEYHLADIAEQFRVGTLQPVTRSFPGMPFDPVDSHVLKIFPIESQVWVQYIVSGMSYAIYQNPARKAEVIARDKRNNEYAEHFDVVPEDVYAHAVAIGLESDTSGRNHRVSWIWEQDGFTCRLGIDASIYSRPHALYYDCILGTQN